MPGSGNLADLNSAFSITPAIFHANKMNFTLLERAICYFLAFGHPTCIFTIICCFTVFFCVILQFTMLPLGCLGHYAT